MVIPQLISLLLLLKVFFLNTTFPSLQAAKEQVPMPAQGWLNVGKYDLSSTEKFSPLKTVDRISKKN